MDVEKPHIDQNALSRQLAVYGHEAQGKLMALRVFIHGISGVSFFLCIARSRGGQEPHFGWSKTSDYLRSSKGNRRGHRKKLLLQGGTHWKGLSSLGIIRPAQRSKPQCPCSCSS
jgi:hypothetical protein